MSDEAATLVVQRRSNGLRLLGEIDAAGVDLLAGHLDPLPEGVADIIIDLAGVTFIDSSGLRALIEVHQRAQQSSRRVVMADPSPAVRRLFDISGLVPYLHVGTAGD